MAKDPKGTRALTSRQIELLREMQVHDGVARFLGDARIPDWGVLKKSMEALGGVWSRKEGGFTFKDGNARILIDEALITGEVPDMRAMGFFPTPPTLAAELVKRASLHTGHLTVLEPSVGHGALAVALLDANPDVRQIQAYDVVPANVDAARSNLHAKVVDRDKPIVVTVETADFLAVKPQRIYDAVIMNPPFSMRQDVRHVEHALSFLKPHGRLAAIMSAGVLYREDTMTRSFRMRIGKLGGAFVENEEGAFLEAGTAVRTVRLHVDLLGDAYE